MTNLGKAFHGGFIRQQPDAWKGVLVGSRGDSLLLGLLMQVYPPARSASQSHITVIVTCMIIFVMITLTITVVVPPRRNLIVK